MPLEHNLLATYQEGTLVRVLAAQDERAHDEEEQRSQDSGEDGGNKPRGDNRGDAGEVGKVVLVVMPDYGFTALNEGEPNDATNCMKWRQRTLDTTKLLGQVLSTLQAPVITSFNFSRDKQYQALELLPVACTATTLRSWKSLAHQPLR